MWRSLVTVDFLVNHPVDFPGFLPVEVGSEPNLYTIIYKVFYTSQVAQDVFHPQHVSSSTSPQKIQQAFFTKPQLFPSPPSPPPKKSYTHPRKLT